jgi:hypothetical protein
MVDIERANQKESLKDIIYYSALFLTLSVSSFWGRRLLRRKDALNHTMDNVVDKNDSLCIPKFPKADVKPAKKRDMPLFPIPLPKTPITSLPTYRLSKSSGT